MLNKVLVNKWILPAIVVAQFFCTSLWFAGNAILPDIVQKFAIAPGFLANITSAVQFGFISGTLVFALFAVADRFSPSSVFFYSSIIAAICNLTLILPAVSISQVLVFRFFTGFFLAGIYPVGMKIASDYYQLGLGKSLSFLVGALVLGTAFPHLLKSSTMQLHWMHVIICTTALAITGGLIIKFFVPDGPYRKKSGSINFTAFLTGFANKKFSAAAIGYFGHMWELYTFWAFVPVIISTYNLHYQTSLNVALLSFFIIAGGAVSCAGGGMLSKYFGAKKIATIALSLSCLCCLISPWLLLHTSATVMVAFLFFWGMVVIADSPLFSSLIAEHVPGHLRGSALTIVNCIGFAITIISIQLIKVLQLYIHYRYVYLLLAIGPLTGIFVLLKKNK